MRLAPTVAVDCEHMSRDARKPGLGGFLPDLTQICLCSHKRRLEALNSGFKKKRDCTIHVAATAVLISWFSHDVAHIKKT